MGVQDKVNHVSQDDITEHTCTCLVIMLVFYDLATAEADIKISDNHSAPQNKVCSYD